MQPVTGHTGVPNGDRDFVHCPKCHQGLNVETIRVIHPGDEALAQLFRSELNSVVCDECGATFSIDVPLLFRDDDARCLIYFLPMEDKPKWQEAERQMEELTREVFGDDLLEEDPPRCRLTATRNTFIEKITLHLHDLDDRAVEYVKYQLYNHPDPGRRIDPVRYELLYDFSADNSEHLPFVVFDRESGQARAAVHLPMDVYHEVVDAFLTDSPDNELGTLFPGVLVTVERLL